MEQNYQTTSESPKHTPAPWFVEESYETLWIWGNKKEKIVVHTKQDNDYKESVKEENKANARLIATAPELLELAKHIIAMEDDAHFCEHPEWAAIVKQAFETFEKATGEKETAI